MTINVIDSSRTNDSPSGAPSPVTQYKSALRLRGLRHWLWLATLCVLIFLRPAGSAPSSSPAARTNDTSARITGVQFGKVDEYFPPPNVTQKKMRIEAAKAVPSPQGTTTLIQEVKVQTWLLNGTPELVIESPECTYDSKNKVVHSPGPLQVKTADGRFFIEGEGFILFQTNSTLLISNNVHTIVHPSVIASPEAKPASAGEKAIEIFSDRFQYASETGVGLYQRNVRAEGTNLVMTCATLEVRVPMKLRELESIHARNDVVMDYEMSDRDIRKIHATGDDAVYYATNGLTFVTGHPTWRADQREGRGDQLIIDATNKIFVASGNAFLKIPSQSLGETGFLPGQNASTTNKTASTNQFTQVFCDHYRFHTNFAAFGDGVRVVQTVDDEPAGTMTCRLMSLSFGATNQVQTMVADEQVVIEQATNQLSGGKAIYTGTNQLLTLTKDPKWRSGLREGKGDLIVVNLKGQEMAVRRNAFMRLPANELGESVTSPGPQAESAGTSKSAAGGVPARETEGGGTNEFAEITSEEYFVRTNSALFTGGVHIRHPRMDWACGIMTVLSAPSESEATKMVAERTVDFHFTDDQGQAVHGTCEKTVYTYRVSAGATNDLAIMTGNPILETADGSVLTNSIIILDRASHKVSAPGKYKLYGRAASPGSNSLERLKKTLNPSSR